MKSRELHFNRAMTFEYGVASPVSPGIVRIVANNSGALTFKGVVTGKAAHAAERLSGVSAIDKYMAVHAALNAHEITVNTNVAHPLMRELELPYPLVVGKLRAGADRYHLAHREIYLHCPNGYGRTKLNNTALERALGLRATTRNWSTVKALDDMAHGRLGG